MEQVKGISTAPKRRGDLADVLGGGERVADALDLDPDLVLRDWLPAHRQPAVVPGQRLGERPDPVFTGAS